MSKPKRKKTGQNYKKPEKISSVAGTSNSINEGANRIEPQHSGQKPQNTDNKSFWEQEKNWEWTGVAVNFILVILTALLFKIAIDQTDAAKDSLKVLKESLLPKVGIYTGNSSFNNNIDVTNPQIIIKNFGNLAAKDVTISARADLRYVDILDDSISVYKSNKENMGYFYAGEEKAFKIPLSSEDSIKGEDTRILFLHFKITFKAFDDPVDNPPVGIKFIREGTKYEECRHNK